jgi:sugar phosphate isomerase/epimerase
MLGVAGAVTASWASVPHGRGQEPAEKKRLGIGASSYGIRRRHDREKQVPQPISNPHIFLDYCRELGAGGMQTNLSSLDRQAQRSLRKKAEEYGMYIEASIGLPKDDEDVSRFEDEVRAAKTAGARIVRSVMLSGRRYETFDTREAFVEFAKEAWKMLTRAEPLIRKHAMRLALENHKDWRIEEMTAMLERIGTPFVGVCIDTGNNIALLDDPMALVEALAPHAYSVHLKDMAMEEYEDGFLLSEVPLGEGYLDLPKIVETLRKEKPNLDFSLEMITRDPLKVPCLTEKYWATPDHVPGRDVARTLDAVRKTKRDKPLPQVSQLTIEERVKIEDDNVRKCLAYAGEHLAL